MSPSSTITVEVVVDSVASARAAERGGAARLELCSSLIEGGITPATGLIELTRAAVSIGIYVMIRPRGGDYCYDDDEFEVMQRDIAAAKRLGADGVVFGILDLRGRIDIARTRLLVELARPLGVTFHRAFDMTPDLPQALEDLCACGLDRVLTSGGEQTALQGSAVLAQLVQKSRNRIALMPGSGIKPENACALVEQTGAKEVHAGLRSSLPSPLLYRNPRISMGAAEGLEYQRFVVLEESVRKLCSAVANIG
jgi:copper homeostasis protein